MLTMEETLDARKQGYQAFMNGKARHNNPYRCVDSASTELHKQWRVGWFKAYVESQND